MGEHRNARPGEPEQSRLKFKGDGYQARQQIRTCARLLWDGVDAGMQAAAANKDRKPIGKRIAESMKRALALGLGKLRRRTA